MRRGTLADLATEFAARNTKGEVVVLIDRGQAQEANTVDLQQELARVLQDHTMRDAVDMVSQAHDVPRREVYRLALDLSKE